MRAEEHDVGGLQLRCGEQVALGHLAAHLVGRAPSQHARKAPLARIRRQLVDAPDEARAVEAAGRRDAEQRLLGRARPAPDVRVADVGDRRRQDAALPRREVGQREGGRGLPDVVAGLGRRVAAPARTTRPPRRGSRAGVGSSSRSSSPAGWFRRSPSMRATASAPVPGRGCSPACASVPWIARAASPRPR